MRKGEINIVETFLISLFFSKLKFNIEIGKFKIHKDSYNIKTLFKRWTVYPVIFMSLLYCIFQFMILHQNYWILPYQKLFKDVLIMSYLLLGLDQLFRYEYYKELIIACFSLIVGFGLNFIAMYFNNGKMPIFPSWSYSTGYTKYEMICHASQYGDFHVLGTYATKFIFLCDTFDVFGFSVWSIGDVFCRIFPFIIIYYSIKSINKIHNKSIDLK